MSVEDRLGTIQQQLERTRRYVRLFTGNTFTPETLAELKDNAKDLCDDAKDELDLVKDEIDEFE